MAVRNKTEFIADEIYYLTFTILGWQSVFVTNQYRRLVYRWFDYVKSKYDNKIHGYVIMPNHIHALVYISSKSPKISVLMQNAKRFMAYSIIGCLEADKKVELLEKFKVKPNNKQAVHRVFQPRYDSLLIQSRKMFLQKLNYIHNNPCQLKWNLADAPEDYKYSSAANYAKGKGNYEVEVIEF
jgi:putative transposase